jgi:hypothetical protein
MPVFQDKLTQPKEGRVIHRTTGSGNDDFSGKDFPTAVESRARAGILAIDLSPSASQPVSIISNSAEEITESFAIPSDVDLIEKSTITRADDAVNAAVKMGAVNSKVEQKIISNTSLDSGSVALEFDDSILGIAKSDNIQNTNGTAINHVGASDNNFVNTETILYGVKGVNNSSTGSSPLTVDFDRAQAQKDGSTAFFQDSAGVVQIIRGSQSEQGNSTGVTCLGGSLGSIDSKISVVNHSDGEFINALGVLEVTHEGNKSYGDLIAAGSSVIDVRVSSHHGIINIGAGATATLFIPRYDFATWGEPVVDGVLNGQVGNKLYGTWASESVYNKVFVEVLSSSNNFESNSPVPIPGMVATVPADGDYVFTSRLNIKPDKDDTMNFYYSKNGINSASRIDSSKFNCSSKKNKDSGVEFSYPIDGLSQGDQIYLLVDTDGEDVDFDERYIRGESWG